MGKNNEGINELVSNLALLADSADILFPTGKKIIVFELPQNEFQMAKIQFNNVDSDVKQFKVDMSGVEIIFLQDELLNVSEDNL